MAVSLSINEEYLLLDLDVGLIKTEKWDRLITQLTARSKAISIDIVKWINGNSMPCFYPIH